MLLHTRLVLLATCQGGVEIIKKHRVAVIRNGGGGEMGARVFGDHPLQQRLARAV